MDYLEFIARVTSHIPDKGQVMIRYYGLYANAHRGKINKAGVLLSHPPIIGEEERFVKLSTRLSITSNSPSWPNGLPLLNVSSRNSYISFPDFSVFDHKVSL